MLALGSSQVATSIQKLSTYASPLPIQDFSCSPPNSLQNRRDAYCGESKPLLALCEKNAGIVHLFCGFSGNNIVFS